MAYHTRGRVSSTHLRPGRYSDATDHGTINAMKLTQYLLDLKAAVTTLESILSSIGIEETRWKPGPTGGPSWSWVESRDYNVRVLTESFSTRYAGETYWRPDGAGVS